MFAPAPLNPLGGIGAPAPGLGGLPGLGLGAASSRAAGLGGLGSMDAMAQADAMSTMALVNDMNQKNQMLEMFTLMLLSNYLRQATGAGGGAAGGGSGSGGVGAVDGAGSSGGGGGVGGASGASGAGSTSGVASGGSGSGKGSEAVDIARKFVGQDSQSIKGKMPNFTAAGGQTNNCADFVSSACEAAGTLKGHHINVRELEQSLIKQGWKKVPAAQAQPGAVWISNSRGHTELVTTQGGTKTIGSNNDRPGHQVISERSKSPNEGVYYNPP